jgi:hypothetical protein
MAQRSALDAQAKPMIWREPIKTCSILHFSERVRWCGHRARSREGHKLGAVDILSVAR